MVAAAVPPAGPQAATYRDVAVARAALEAVATQEFAKISAGRPSANRNVMIAARSMAVSESLLRQLRLTGAQGHWPEATADRVRDANRGSKRLELTLEGFASSKQSASVALEASLPGYIDREAYVFVQVTMPVRHAWVVRLVQQDDEWQVLAAVPIAAS